MKVKKLFLALVVPTMLFGVVGCQKSGGNNSGIPSAPSRTDEEYEAWIDGWSESGHLYMHYLRPNAQSLAEYDDWGIWLWPKGKEGTMWGAVNDACKVTVPHVMTETRMTNIGGSGYDSDQHGVIYDIDLTRSDIVGGKTGKPVSFEGAKKVGFLVADLRTMDGSTHWTSDGGADLFLEDFQTHWRSNGAMHVFLNQGDTANYSYTSGGGVSVNPTIDDRTGQYRSNETRLTDKYPNQVSPTSDDFAGLGVGYQIFVSSFRDGNGDGQGDIRGIINALDYLKNDMSVQVLWLTPIFKCGSYHGYDTIDYYQIDEQFGTNEDFQELLTEAHSRGMKVILDLVLNHTSKNHTWYRNSQKAAVGEDPALPGQTINWRDIYHWKYYDDDVLWFDASDLQYKTIKVQNHPDWYKDGESNYYYYGKFGSGMPELNYDNQATRDLVIALGQYWLNKGVDGYRLDAVKHIYMKDEVADPGSDIVVWDIGSKSAYDNQLIQFVNKSFDYSSDVTRNVEFWKEFAFGLKTPAKGGKASCFLVGENFDGYGARISPYYQALDSQFDFSNFFHIDEWVYQRKDSKNPVNYSSSQASDSYTMYKSSADNSPLYENTDGNDETPSVQTFPNQQHPSGFPTGHRSSFINGAFTSNHDTLRAINNVSNNIQDVKKEVVLKDDNNQPVYDDKGNLIKFTTSCIPTSGSAKTEAQNRAKVAAAMTVLNTGLSWIYYGDELGMSSNTDKHIEKYKNPNNEDLWYRQPFKWQDSSVVTNYNFDEYQVEWDDYNAVLPDMETQKTQSTSILNYYKQLCAIKAQYGKDMTYYGGTGVDNVVYWSITCKNTDPNHSETMQSFHVFVNTGNTVVYNYNQSSYATGARTFINAGTTSSTNDAIQPYSTVVVRNYYNA